MPKAKKTKSGSWKVRVLDHEEIICDENGEPVRRPDGKIKKKQYFATYLTVLAIPRQGEELQRKWLLTGWITRIRLGIRCKI